MARLPNRSKACEEILLFALAAQNAFEADFVHTQFAYCKRSVKQNSVQTGKLLAKEEELVKQLLMLIARSPYIGYEASNHYFYTQNNLLEKLVNIQLLRGRKI